MREKNTESGNKMFKPQTVCKDMYQLSHWNQYYINHDNAGFDIEGGHTVSFPKSNRTALLSFIAQVEAYVIQMFLHTINLSIPMSRTLFCLLRGQ